MRTVDVLIPGGPGLPTNYDGSEHSVVELFGLVCRRMGLDASQIELLPGTDEDMADVHGLYAAPNDEFVDPRIFYRASLAADPHRLLATLAHEAAHELLRLRLPEVYLDDDMELCTDMLPVLYGFGVFMANSTLRETSEIVGNWYFRSLSKSGYLTAEVFGYVLALFEWIRGDSAPNWLHNLRPDAARSCTAGLKFLRKTGDCVFCREMDEQWPQAFTASQLRSELEARSATRQANALIELCLRPSMADDLQAQIVNRLSSRDADIRLLALKTLQLVEHPEEDSYFRILECEHDSDLRIRRLLSTLVRPDAGDIEF